MKTLSDMSDEQLMAEAERLYAIAIDARDNSEHGALMAADVRIRHLAPILARRLRAVLAERDAAENALLTIRELEKREATGSTREEKDALEAARGTIAAAHARIGERK